MATILHTQNGKTVGGQRRERIAMTLAWLASWFFIPLKFRGYWRVVRPLWQIFQIETRQWVVLKSGLTFTVDMTDPYWNRLISPYFIYEPEMHLIAEKLKHEDYVFLDCGANMGYWSCLMASENYGNKPVIAVEPLSDNFALLDMNAKANTVSIEAYRNAISDKDNQSVTLYQQGGHASVSLLKDAQQSTQNEEVVQTITLDKLTEKQRSEAQDFYLKLDVEGVEIEALNGAGELLKSHPIIVYEDHGMDKESHVTKHLIHELNYQIYYITDAGKCEKIATVEDANKWKIDITRGYNFIAFHAKSKLGKQFIKSFEN